MIGGVIKQMILNCGGVNGFVGAHFFAGRQKYGHTYPYSVFYHAKLGIV